MFTNTKKSEKISRNENVKLQVKNLKTVVVLYKENIK